MATSETESAIAGFLAKYDQEIAAEMEAARAIVHHLFPTGYEHVYDNYNALVFGFGPTTRASDAVVSLAAYPRWISLFFLNGVSLDDPHRLLQGKAKQVRSIRLTSAGDLNKPEIQQLIVQARQPQQEAFDQAMALQTIIKSVSAKQRPRRPE